MTDVLCGLKDVLIPNVQLLMLQETPYVVSLTVIVICHYFFFFFLFFFFNKKAHVVVLDLRVRGPTRSGKERVYHPPKTCSLSSPCIPDPHRLSATQFAPWWPQAEILFPRCICTWGHVTRRDDKMPPIRLDHGPNCGPGVCSY